MPTTVSKGTKFRATYADGNPEWVVTGKVGRDAWRCKVTDDMDWAGVVKLFSTDEIRRCVAMFEFFTESNTKSLGFYDTAKLGSVVHYHNGFRQYVRCEVVEGVTTHSKGKTIKCLKPVALVGAWKPYDLPCRDRDGSINYGHHAGDIIAGKTFDPHASNIWESPAFQRKPGEPDPSALPALDLSVPDMTPVEAGRARLEVLRRDLQVVLETEDAAEAINGVKALLGVVNAS